MKMNRNENAIYRSREEQAEKIIKVVEDYLKSGLQDLSCLDIGCATGIMSNIFRSKFNQVFAFDINGTLVNQAKQSSSAGDINWLVADGGLVPFPNETFDVVICAQIYEHTKNQSALTSEIIRILRNNGICFFSGPNRLSIIEAHYRLPFLSWLPKPLADGYMRLAKRGTKYDIYPLNYWQLRKLLSGCRIYDYTLKIVAEPERFGLHSRKLFVKIFSRFPGWVKSSFPLWIPNFNWIFVKQENIVNEDTS